MAKGLRERVGKQYKGPQRTRKAVHGECSVELAKWTFPIIALSREPYTEDISIVDAFDLTDDLDSL
jgi:hypothetical protein